MRPVWRSLLVVAGAVALVLLAAVPAWADAATPTNYRSQILYTEGPGVVEVEIVGGDAFVRMTTESGMTVEVLGYEGEEYIRFDPDGAVVVNQRSPATYLNDDRYANVELPAEADASAVPRWETVSTDGTYSWHDHRTHWMSPTPPASVLATDGNETVQIFDWILPLRVEGSAGRIVGTLTWIPSTTALPWFALTVVTLVAVAAATLRIGPRSQSVVLLVLGLGAVVAGGAAMLAQPPEGRVLGIDLIGPPVVMVVAGFAALQARRSSRLASQLVLIGSVGLSAWGVLRVGVLTHPILPTLLPYAADRLITAMVLGGAIGLVVGITTSITLENRAERIAGDGHHAT
ncbi:MAG: hypothetical protein WCC01_13605 [Acidimicrobiia bacterium]